MTPEEEARLRAYVLGVSNSGPHVIYPDGPLCGRHCVGPWSTYHEGYADGYERAQGTERIQGKCGCNCICHHEESDETNWPGPCAACCEPGMNCDCGRALIHLLFENKL